MARRAAVRHSRRPPRPRRLCSPRKHAPASTAAVQLALAGGHVKTECVLFLGHFFFFSGSSRLLICFEITPPLLSEQERYRKRRQVKNNAWKQKKNTGGTKLGSREDKRDFDFRGGGLLLRAVVRVVLRPRPLFPALPEVHRSRVRRFPAERPFMDQAQLPSVKEGMLGACSRRNLWIPSVALLSTHVSILLKFCNFSSNSGNISSTFGELDLLVQHVQKQQTRTFSSTSANIH